MSCINWSIYLYIFNINTRALTCGRCQRRQWKPTLSCLVQISRLPNLNGSTGSCAAVESQCKEKPVPVVIELSWKV